MSQILSYISGNPDITEIYLVPNAPIVDKKNGKFVKITDTLLTAEDVRDTLFALRSYASHLLGPIGNEGTFSFGIQNIGRIRVSYITQRGSYVVNIVKTPYFVPALEDLCDDPKIPKLIDELIRINSSGIVLLSGTNPLRVSAFAYSVIQHVSKNYQKIILILERPLSFLVKHSKSIVIQREVGIDTPTFEDGLRDISYINPDFLYVGYKEVLPAEDILHIVRAVELSTLVMFYSPYMNEEALLKSFEKHKKLVRAIIGIEPSQEGRLQVYITDRLP